MSTYTPSLPLQGALERIKNPPVVYNRKNEPVPTRYEHHVSTWACTKLSETFTSSGDWAITPEQRDQNTHKKPDFTVEKAIMNPSNHKISMKIHLCMELKKKGGDRIEDALNQLRNSLEETLDTKGNTYKDEFEIFAVVQSGLDIGFFEFHEDQSNLDEEDIPHFLGCVSLTQDYKIKGVDQVVIPNKPNDLLPLYHNFSKLRKETDVRLDAKEYNTPCIYNLDKHQKEINDIFCYMESHKPRSTW
jgi:hypothetical protein